MYCSKGSSELLFIAKEILLSRHFAAPNKVNRYLSGISSNYPITQFILTRMATNQLTKIDITWIFATI